MSGSCKNRIVVSVDFTGSSGASGQAVGRAGCGSAGTAARGRAGDDNGHGTHVAGIIAAAGVNAKDTTSGVAPGAHIINLKVLGADGSGYASDVADAIDWAIENRDRYKIKVINLSLGGPVLQRCADDPVCQAVERAYRARITVVVSAGNHGKDANGNELFGRITMPGVSPFAITVGALNTKGTAQRSDDVITTYSSRGPTWFDGLIKPDLVAPGNKIVGLLAPGSTLAREHPELVIDTTAGQAAAAIGHEHERSRRVGRRRARARSDEGASPRSCSASASANGQRSREYHAAPGGHRQLERACQRSQSSPDRNRMC